MILKANEPSEWRDKESFDKVNDLKQKLAFEIETKEKPELSRQDYKKAYDLFMYFARQVEPAFEIDDPIKAIIKDILDWLLNNPCGKYDPMKGLMFVGNVGTGKTTLMKIVKEAGRVMRFQLEDCREYAFRITPMTEIAAYYQKHGMAAMSKEFAVKECQAIDDVGTEPEESLNMGNRANPFAIIIESKYNHRNSQRHIFHMTTNLSNEEIASRYGRRTLDRLKQMVNIVILEGTSRRSYKSNYLATPIDRFRAMARGD